MSQKTTAHASSQPSWRTSSSPDFVDAKNPPDDAAGPGPRDGAGGSLAPAREIGVEHSPESADRVDQDLVAWKPAVQALEHGTPQHVHQLRTLGHADHDRVDTQ